MRVRVSSLVVILLSIIGFLVAGCASDGTPPEGADVEADSGTDDAAPESAGVEVDRQTDGVADAEASPAASSDSDDVIYLNLMWHQHQPQYYLNDEGVYTRPWVRVHATKDYYDMAAILRDYPELRVTFNLTPVLLMQLEALASGTKDVYWVLAEKEASELTVDEKRFILTRFFDANHTHIIGRFPRYRELLTMRGDGTSENIDAALQRWSDQDFRDLQVWFNLAWFDPDFLEREPLLGLVEKGRDFAESDKPIIFDEALQIIRGVVDVHRELQDAGQIEVTTTPYAHPILPLVFNSDIVEVNDPGAEVPPRFSYPNDAIAHLSRSVEIYEETLGRPVRGLWPGEGAVAEEIVRIVGDAGYRWMASGEQVLARSIGLDGFARDENDVVREADDLYRPYYVESGGRRVAVVFRDLRVSDLVGFEYSGTPGEQAARDFVGRIDAIRERLNAEGAEGPHLVSVILDGENAWENYPNDGKAFFHALYSMLSESPTIRTITPSEYLDLFPEQREIESLWPGAWFSPDYATWIGEPEETLAWDYLGRVRSHLAKYDIQRRRQTTEEALAEALNYMYLAEGSDWFWWYGQDQDSGNDDYFDEGFRALLAKVYTALGDEVPEFVRVPIIPDRAVSPDRSPSEPIVPTVDGVANQDEWAGAGVYRVAGGAMARGGDVVTSVRYGYGPDALSFAIDGRDDWVGFAGGAIDVYLTHPAAEATRAFSLNDDLLGIRAAYAIRVDRDAMVEGDSEEAVRMFSIDSLGRWAPVAEPRGDGRERPPVIAAVEGRTVEISISLSALPELQPGDAVDAKVVVAASGGDQMIVPAAGPVRMVLPDLGNTTLVGTIVDPEGDDHGPGSYTYPTDSVFAAGAFDIRTFNVAYNERNVIFSFTMGAPIDNPWGSGIGLSLQTFDVYIDLDPTDVAPGANPGRKLLLEGRNAALDDGIGWDAAVWVEGWNQKLLVAGEGGPVEVPGTPVRAVVDGAAGRVSLLVSRDALPAGDPASWGYLGVVLSQEGYPSPGVRRVRDVSETASQWRLGGAPAGSANHTRIIDVALPDAGLQEERLAAFPVLPALSAEGVSADDTARLPIVRFLGG